MSEPLPQIIEFAEQAVSYVKTALTVELAFDSDTLPLIDHYLREVPVERKATVALVVSTAGAYFGEVVRRHMGGRWELTGEDPVGWRLVLPTGLSFSPAGLVAAVIARSDDLSDVDTGFDVPAAMRSYVEDALARMSQVTEEVYFSLCGRFDTLEHLQEVLVAVAARKLAEREDGGDGR